jgi:hypothetical protein
VIAVQVDLHGCRRFGVSGHGVFAELADSISAIEPRVFGNQPQ